MKKMFVGSLLMAIAGLSTAAYANTEQSATVQAWRNGLPQS